MYRDRLITIAEIARLYSISDSTIRRLLRTGRIPAKKVGGQWRFDLDDVRKAFDSGLLSNSNASTGQINRRHFLDPPDWCKEVVDKWKRGLSLFLRETQPKHVVVNDRRGAKVWALMGLEEFSWGTTLWHSTSIELMSFGELQRRFAGTTVLLFDEMMQHGKAMNDLRRLLEDVETTVFSFVCARRLSHLNDGLIREPKAFACEDLNDKEFADRATTISRLISYLDPPLDVDHLVIRGALDKPVDVGDFLRRLVNWGKVFVVRHDEKGNDIRYIAITLDRPSFVGTDEAALMSSLDVNWSGPCKVRFYLDPMSGECFCSFIVFPELKGTFSAWIKVFENLGLSAAQIDETGIRGRTSESLDISRLKALYELICQYLAVSILRRFVESGAADSIGFKLQPFSHAYDSPQLLATFGDSYSEAILDILTPVYNNLLSRRGLFDRAEVPSPIPPRLRSNGSARAIQTDIFGCRIQILDTVPQKYQHDNASDDLPLPLSYLSIMQEEALQCFTESTVSRVIDYELDWGTIKPENYVQIDNHREAPVLFIWRGFYRGEYDPWFRPDSEVVTHEDRILQRTCALGPSVVDAFLTRTKWDFLGRVHFAKVFSNLLLDWHDSYGRLQLHLEPYKYGPMPKVLIDASSRHATDYDRFLMSRQYIANADPKKGARPKLIPNSANKELWQKQYRSTLSAPARTNISGLVRLYSAIQTQCVTQRIKDPRSSGIGLFQDPLVVLASARNRKTAYICGRYEVSDWLRQGKFLRAVLQSLPELQDPPEEPYLKAPLSQFAEPARLLFDKLEMFKNIGQLRNKIENLVSSGVYDSSEILLESVEDESIDDDQRDYPVEHLDKIVPIMRAFSSLCRRVMTQCGFDSDERGKSQEASTYLEELIANCVELKPFEPKLQECVKESRKGVFTAEMKDTLINCFTVVESLLGSTDFLPDPRAVEEFNIVHWERDTALPDLLHETSFPDPCAIAVADLRNAEHIAHFITSVSHLTFFDAFKGVVQRFRESAERTIARFENTHLGGISSDCLVFFSDNPNELYMCSKMINEEAVHVIEEDVRELKHLAPHRTGIAWHASNDGRYYKDVPAGICAYRLADRSGEPAGSIALTQTAFERIDQSTRQGLQVSVGETCNQGIVYRLKWEFDAAVNRT